MAKILYGKEIAREIKSKLIKGLNWRVAPKLGSIIIGDDPSAGIYVDSQKRLCGEFGIEYIIKKENSSVSLEKIDKIIKTLKKENVAGIIVQLPLPKNICHEDVIRLIGPQKDIEGLHPENIGRLFCGSYSVVPCVPAAVMELIKRTKINLRGREVVIIGHSQIVGKPLSMMLLNEFATVTICHIATSERNLLKAHVNKAEILISAVGAKGFFVKGDWVKKGAIVIDVATKKVGSRICGDIDFDGAKKKASYITPVPGGVGPITNIMLIKNFIELYRRME